MLFVKIQIFFLYTLLNCVRCLCVSKGNPEVILQMSREIIILSTSLGENKLEKFVFFRILKIRIKLCGKNKHF